MKTYHQAFNATPLDTRDPMAPVERYTVLINDAKQIDATATYPAHP